MLPPGYLSIAYITGRLTPKVFLRTRLSSHLAPTPSDGAADLANRRLGNSSLSCGPGVEMVPEMNVQGCLLRKD